MSLGKQRDALILLITETATQLLVWRRGALRELGLYDENPEDQQLFVEQLRLHPKYPALIVTDLVDENFRHDTVVHVGGADREALFQRKLDFAFRNTRYRKVSVTGRQSEGRKDDRILLSALTKPERIDQWARLMLEQKVAIQAVTSLAHLVGNWLPLLQLEQEEYLLLCQLDPDNNLRQTFVRKGGVMFSRLASLTTVPERRLGVEILQESAQLRQYLERIQFLSYESQLRIVLHSPLPEETVQLESFSSDLNRFETVHIEAPCAALDIHLEQGQLLPAHYLLASLLRRKRIDNVYAPPALTRFQDRNSLGRWLLGTAAATVLLGMGLNVPGLLDALDRREQARSMSQRAAPLRAEYEALTTRFAPSPAPPREMQLVVDTYRTIEAQVRSPLWTLNRIASALATVPGLVITGISWNLEEKRFDATPDAYGNVPQPPPRLPGLSGEQALTGALLQNNTEMHVVISGEAYSPQSFRAAQDQVTQFMLALEALERVQVTATQLPIDVRPEVDLNTTINDSEVRSPFSIDLRIALPAPEPDASSQMAGAAP